MNRRSFLRGAAAASAAVVAAPWVITTPGVLMPVKKMIWLPPRHLWTTPALFPHALRIIRLEWSETYGQFDMKWEEGLWSDVADKKMEASL